MSIRDDLAAAQQHQQAGRLGRAEEIYHRILNISPENPGILYALGLVTLAQGRLDEAESFTRRSIQQKGDFAQAHNNLGCILVRRGSWPDAAAAFSRATELKPDMVEAHNNLGSALLRLHRLEDAEASFRRTVELSPYDPRNHYNLGHALKRLGRCDESIQAFDAALSIRPDFAEAYNSRGGAFICQGKIDQAVEDYQQALSINGQFADAHLNLGLARLIRGEFEQGWPEFEWRLKCKMPCGPRPQFAQPRWRGEQLASKRVLLHAEEGYGDTIHFCRYAPMVAERGGQVVLQCPQPLIKLLSSLAGVAEVVTAESTPQFDCHCPLMSLPGTFQTTVTTVPCDVPYIQPAADDIDEWGRRLGPRENFRVGVVWSGSPNSATDRERTIPAELFAPLTATDGAAFYSLQVEHRPGRLRLPPGDNVIDLAPQLTDFAETAAAISNLDLIISADTAVAHLAGAMGRDVWVLLPHIPDPRWLLGREDSPWYPTARLFRQKTTGDWPGVIERVRQALQERLASKACTQAGGDARDG